MQVTVTGGAGFIGANLCRSLVAAGHDVVVIDDLSTGRAENLEGLGVEFHQGTILDDALLDRTLGAADAVVHLAARPSVARSISDPMASHLANATGTVSVLEAVRRAGTSRRAPQVIVASSSSVYGATATLPKSEDLPTVPLSPYAASKLATEAYAVAYHHSYGLDVLAFRFFNVFGPLQAAGHAYAAVVPAFLSAALDGRPLVVHGDGRQSRDFTFVDTVSSVIADAIERRVFNERPVNLAFGSRTDLLGVIAELERLLGRNLPVAHVETRPGDVRHSQADASLLHSLFPSVKPVSLSVGLARTLAWFEEERAARSQVQERA
jgi:UDP-glucose 4-epimerase